MGQRELHALVLAIGRRSPTLDALLRESPALARAAYAENGGYVREIEHQVYAGDTLLHAAAACHRPLVARALIGLGANVRARNRRGAEPLHYAADGNPNSARWDPEGQAEVVACLLEAGAKHDALDKSGVAPLHRAARTRCTGAVRTLLAGGADPRLLNKSGSTPIDLAEQTTGRGGSGSPECKREQAIIFGLLTRAGRR